MKALSLSFFHGLTALGLCCDMLQAPAATMNSVPALYARGFALVPEPQQVELGEKDFAVDANWTVELGEGVAADDVAVSDLRESWRDRFGFAFSESQRGNGGIIRLSIKRGSVEIGHATDRELRALHDQAYRIALRPGRVEIQANATTGLFYGVQTLLQLPRQSQDKLWLPDAEIRDWPDLQLRIIYWDDAHHLERLSALKESIHQAAFFKINGFALKLEGHFQYRSAPAIVEPYALSPAELQELTDFARHYHVELIPYLDAPAHVSFILKHPKYAPLREFPESNYQFCATNPGTYQLLYGMFQELLDANRGGKFFVLSTDEPYYVGLSDRIGCDEAARAREFGSVGKLLAEFVSKTAGYLHQRDRTVLFWGEYPLKPEDVSALPQYLVNGEVNGPAFDRAFKARGIRQLIYTSTEGEEPLFPNYDRLAPDERLHARPEEKGRVAEMIEHIAHSSSRRDSDLMGAFVAGWADAGLHPETFWLGYATGPAAAWNAGTEPDKLTHSFLRLFYGSAARQMARLYRLLSRQAEFWEDSWETAPSKARPPIFGNSYGVFHPARAARDQTLPMLPKLKSDLLLESEWLPANERRLALARRFLAENDEVRDLIQENLLSADFHHYNLEVLGTVAQLCRQNLELLLEFGQIDRALRSADREAREHHAEAAVGAIDSALEKLEAVRQARNRVLNETTAVWYRTWFPRVAEANGRRYLDQVDDVKDHRPVRTIDMSYLVYRELLLPMDDWEEEVTGTRNEYAEKNHLAARIKAVPWKSQSPAAE